MSPPPRDITHRPASAPTRDPRLAPGRFNNRQEDSAAKFATPETQRAIIAPPAGNQRPPGTRAIFSRLYCDSLFFLRTRNKQRAKLHQQAPRFATVPASSVGAVADKANNQRISKAVTADGASEASQSVRPTSGLYEIRLAGLRRSIAANSRSLGLYCRFPSIVHHPVRRSGERRKKKRRPVTRFAGPSFSARASRASRSRDARVVRNGHGASETIAT